VSGDQVLSLRLASLPMRESSDLGI